MNEPRELVLLSQASRALEQASTVDEVKDLRDKAEAVKAYARKAKLGHSILIEASLIKVNAERKLGEILRETELAKAAPGNQYTAGKETAAEGSPTLASLGISKSDSSRLQQIAGLPDDVFEGYVQESVATQREPTTAGLLRLAKQQGNGVSNGSDRNPRTTPGHPRGDGTDTTTDLDELVEQGRTYGTVYADPPWPYKNQGTRAATGNHYATMSVDAICAEPVARLVGEQAHLHLWTTNAFLLDAFDVIEAWGFEYKSCFVWVKPQIGIGNYWRVSHEFLCDRSHKYSYVVKCVMWRSRVELLEMLGRRTRERHIIFASSGMIWTSFQSVHDKTAEPNSRDAALGSSGWENYVVQPARTVPSSELKARTPRHN